MYPTNGNFANVAPTYVDIPGMYPTNGKPIWYSCSTKFSTLYWHFTVPWGMTPDYPRSSTTAVYYQNKNKYSPAA